MENCLHSLARGRSSILDVMQAWSDISRKTPTIALRRTVTVTATVTATAPPSPNASIPNATLPTASSSPRIAVLAPDPNTSRRTPSIPHSLVTHGQAQQPVADFPGSPLTPIVPSQPQSATSRSRSPRTKTPAPEPSPQPPRQRPIDSKSSDSDSPSPSITRKMGIFDAPSGKLPTLHVGTPTPQMLSDLELAASRYFSLKKTPDVRDHLETCLGPLQGHYNVDKTAKDETDLVKWITEVSRIDKIRRREIEVYNEIAATRDRERSKRDRTTTSDITVDRPPKRKSSGSNSHRPPQSTSSSSSTGPHLRCPQLTPVERKLLEDNFGCFKCRIPFADHRSTDNACDFPPPAPDYKTVTVALVKDKYRSLSSDLKKKFASAPGALVDGW
ncbi:hypothetical protein B0H17DRAFT_1195460 [Mycena rosella]|uniref:Uncharacterized protein n=1 Tax=Mycena rosella TaxID=1033263 RepID=A0AAD7GLW6_MYCRO|nr:hypothetical protein B0H17DRAFT_1195460 [Mycena rosella]